MKLIIDIEKDYYELIKHMVENGQNFIPFSIIANGKPYVENIDVNYLHQDSITKTTADCIIAYGDGYETARRLYAKRPKGEWIEGNCLSLICSNCKEEALDFNDYPYKSNYCPKCGAQMVGGNKE